MEITAQMVKELRERTGSGMMECKKALQEAGGDMETAVENMRKAGLAKADKKADRTAAEGAIVQAVSGDGAAVAMVEVNSETDFVAKADDFRQFADAVARQVLERDPDDREALLDLAADEAGTDIRTRSKELVAKIGENINVRRFVRFRSSGNLGCYIHGGRIGVVVDLEGGDTELARDIAMHIAASHPICIAPEDVPTERLDKERAMLVEQAKESGKPDEIVEKMVEGRLKKYLEEITLLGQPFVKDPDTTVGELVQSRGARVVAFERFEVGEGIERKSENFAEEVMAQVHGG